MSFSKTWVVFLFKKIIPKKQKKCGDYVTDLISDILHIWIEYTLGNLAEIIEIVTNYLIKKGGQWSYAVIY